MATKFTDKRKQKTTPFGKLSLGDAFTIWEGGNFMGIKVDDNIGLLYSSFSDSWYRNAFDVNEEVIPLEAELIFY